LVLVGAVADFTEAIEEHPVAERILLLALVEANVTAAAQFGILQPVQREQRSLELV
jgi:hypothetical protein